MEACKGVTHSRNPGGWLPVFAVKAPWCVCVVREGGGGAGRLKQAVNPFYAG